MCMYSGGTTKECKDCDCGWMSSDVICSAGCVVTRYGSDALSSGYCGWITGEKGRCRDVPSCNNNDDVMMLSGVDDDSPLTNKTFANMTNQTMNLTFTNVPISLAPQIDSVWGDMWDGVSDAYKEYSSWPCKPMFSPGYGIQCGWTF
eukprot:CAMPEP_0206123958 /NCGR_PEP_ID=MMETSP1472-20131121/8243_1 /ASSEMBLY_ACC=CAM_ASM_001108 /TAXON_ID=41880 /ORGANISM="Pycnococcus provasolii, Strain RCC251" /LENGTH=146 /DNA_ID=CAMNT_0053514641 /DNA_START=171 /DNA_END=611 /DNA_ORIENTATION=+